MTKTILLFSLLTVLLPPLTGCGEKSSNNNSEASATIAKTKELTPEEKFDQMKQKAESGDAMAQANLVMMYDFGEGVHQDSDKAKEWFEKAAAQVEWFQKAATQGDARAQLILGAMYRSGIGVTKDESNAFNWVLKSATQGDALAQNLLASMYKEGKGVQKDKAKSVDWQLKSATQGNVHAQLSLGSMYRDGEDDVLKDAAKALEWFQKAADQGNAEAQTSLGGMYAKGIGVPKDESIAAGWYQKAAAQGDAGGQYMLSLQYSLGKGVQEDKVLAYAWANLSSSDSHYAFLRDEFERRLTTSERIEAQHLSSGWKKGQLLVREGSSATAGAPSNPGVLSRQSTGTAFAVSNEGHALTNHHVINGCTEVKVAGREGIVKVITSDSVNDLALLQLPGNIRDVASLNPDLGKLRQGEDIIVFGYPLNSVLSSGGNLTPGMISALTGLGNNTNQIQITASIQPGSSGSPVMDKKGNIVGVVSMKLDDGKMVKATGQVGQNVNFAVNGQTIKAFLDTNKVQYKTGGGFFTREKSSADIAEEARKWTVLVECWK